MVSGIPREYASCRAGLKFVRRVKVRITKESEDTKLRVWWRFVKQTFKGNVVVDRREGKNIK